MTVERVGERFILGFTGDRVPAWLAEFAARFSLGGVILFDYDARARRYGNNIRSRNQLIELTAAIAALPSRPLVFVDQEGGKVRRLKESLGFAPLPSQKALASLPETDALHLLETALREIRDLGFSYDLAPVLDLDTNPLNPDIGALGRSYSADAVEVRRMVDLIDNAARRAGLGLCLKHYPGLGGATVNSHLALTDITGSFSDDQLELFHRLGERVSGEAVLMSHGIVRDWDPTFPVSMSEVAISRLRRQLPAVLLISDDLQMRGLQEILPSAEACVQGARAGLDLILIGNNLLDEHEQCSGFASNLARTVEVDPRLSQLHEESLARIADRKVRFAAACETPRG